MSGQSTGKGLRTASAARETEAFLTEEIRTAGEALIRLFGDRLAAIVLGGSFGRGEGCIGRFNGELLMVNNADIFLITREPIVAEELARARREILARCSMEAVALTPLLQDAIPGLPLTLRSLDLKLSHRVVAGDAAALSRLPDYDPSRLPLREAEDHLRRRLGTLLDGFPAGRNSFRRYYQTAKAVLAAIDSVLIRDRRYSTACAEKVQRFKEKERDLDLTRLAEHALIVKIRGRIPSGVGPDRFWKSAVRFYLDRLLELFHPPGASRDDRLAWLLERFHYRSIERRRTFRNRIRSLLGRGNGGSLDRLLLALCAAVDAEDLRIDLAPHAASLGIPKTEWQECHPAALALWSRLAEAESNPSACKRSDS